MNLDNQIDGMSQNTQKYLVFGAMGLIFAGCMFLIFKPSKKEEDVQGFNIEIPMPTTEGLIDDKREAYRQEMMQQRQNERMRSLQDFSEMFFGNESDDVELLPDDVPTQAPIQRIGGENRNQFTQPRTQNPIHGSSQAYHDLNRTLENFFVQPPESRENSETERLIAELEVLQMQLNEAASRSTSMDNQLELMERSFEMAARFMPNGGNVAGTLPLSTGTAMAAGATEYVPPTTTNVSGRTTVVPVDRVQKQIVSALLHQMSDAEFIETFSQPRNMGFLTVYENANTGIKNTVSASIHGNQTIMDGQNVRLRLLEPMQAGNVVMPRNSLLTGIARIQGERLWVTVNSLEFEGMILPIELRVYDLDGQQGIFIPNMAELGALKEIVANMGTSAGTSISLSGDAGSQFAADMGRNAIQGISQFTARKLREVKVNLKDGYRIFLLTNK